MKAILEMEMPACCGGCDLFNYDWDDCYYLHYFSQAEYNWLAERRPDCPLKLKEGKE